MADPTADDPEELAARVAELVQARDATLGVAESLTGGLLSSHLARAEDASSWFLGGVVSYGRSVKHGLLDVRPGPVVSEPAARDMAVGARRVLATDLGLAVTGAGGPDPQDGQEPGTVWVASAVDGEVEAEVFHLPGDPAEVCTASVAAALGHLLSRLEAAGA